MIADIANVLTDLGYVVDHDIDDTKPCVEQQETESPNGWRSGPSVRTDKWTATAAASHKKATGVYDHIPFGQPILIGHHSEKADHNQRERAWKNLGTSYEQASYASELQPRAETASNHMDARYNPVTVMKPDRNDGG